MARYLLIVRKVTDDAIGRNNMKNMGLVQYRFIRVLEIRSTTRFNRTWPRQKTSLYLSIGTRSYLLKSVMPNWSNLVCYCPNVPQNYWNKEV